MIFSETGSHFAGSCASPRANARSAKPLECRDRADLYSGRTKKETMCPQRLDIRSPPRDRADLWTAPDAQGTNYRSSGISLQLADSEPEPAPPIARDLWPRLTYFMQSIAVSIVRNCRDIIALSVLHHVLLGVDRCIVVDNGSTDGTRELLQSIANRLPKVEIRSDPSDFRQAEMMNAVINQYTRKRRTLIIPFDADEFWDAPVGAITQWMERKDVNVVRNPVVHFVQSRSVTAPTRFSALRAFRTAIRTFPAERSLVYDRQCSFVETVHPAKVIFCAADEVAIGIGSHDVQMPDPKLATGDQFCCLHLPLRSKAELTKRAFDYEPRRSPFRQHPSRSWQSLYFHEMMLRGEGEALWRANPYDGSGMIDIFGQHRPTRIDMRLMWRMARAHAYGLYLRVPTQSRA